jgi:serine phosphatase RsbU (regulator of sigma subunit)
MRRIVTKRRCHDPAEILRQMNLMVKTSLHQDKEYSTSDDGMDVGICFAEPDRGILTFAGARFPLHYLRNGETVRVRGDRQSIGYKRSDPDFEFTDHVIPVEKGMAFYLISDGFEDQFGQDRETGKTRSFGRERLCGLLSDMAGLLLEQQGKELLEAFEAHRNGMPRQDDVTVVGFAF